MQRLIYMLVALMGVLPSGGIAAEPAWMRGLTPLSAPEGKWAPLEGRFHYQFGWSGLQAAKGELRFSPGPTGVLRLDTLARTTGAARTLWRLDAQGFSEVEAGTFRPIQMRVAEKYRSRTVLSILQFQPGEVLYSKGRVAGEPPKKFFSDPKPFEREELQRLTGEKVRRLKFPEMLDLQGALLWVRQQPLKTGDRMQFVIFHENAAYLAKIRVKPRENLVIQGVRQRAIPLEISLQWFDKERVLREHKKFKSATGWYSDDAKRLPLRLEVEVFVGRIWAELRSH